MARPIKQGIDYFPLDVNFFSDIKIRRLTIACGPNSAAVVLSLLCNIYQDKGYYISWNNDLPFIIADAVGITEDAVLNIVEKALQIGLFNNDIFDQYGVLTSKGIQKRYLLATERRKKIEWNENYLETSIKKQINDNNNIIKTSNNLFFVNDSTQSKEKENK